jgi:hypothetical protein
MTHGRRLILDAEPRSRGETRSKQKRLFLEASRLRASASKVILALLLLTTAFGQSPPRDLDLFLLIGQSNMAGRGVVEARDKQPIAGVWMLTEKMEWAPAVDPLHFDKPAVTGVGIGRTFARTLLEKRPGAAIGLIPAAFGGSALDEWGTDGKHYPNAVARAKEAMKSGKLRGILWHQGEADSKASLAPTYRDRFSKFIARLRADLGAGDVPVMVGQLGEFYQPDSEWTKKMVEQLATIPLVVPNAAFVPSSGLKAKSDHVHFDSASLREFGRRYALAYLTLDPKWAAPASAKPAALTVPELPPDRKAYDAAIATKDPKEKIAALEAFREKYPDSQLSDGVDDAIFQTLVRRLPEQQKRIFQLAEQRYGEAPEAQKGRVANDIAAELLDAGVHLKRAEQWSRRSVKPLREETYLAEQRALYEKRKQTPPPEQEAKKRFAELRAARIGTLGRIMVKRGNTAKGRALLEEAWADNPNLAPVAVALGELSVHDGDDKQALEYLTAARLIGRAPPTAVSNFETVYRKLHKGSFEGAEEYLDQEYRRRYSNPVHAESYRPGAGRSDRVVLAEVFTGAGCGPCVAADLATDALLERYKREEVAVLMYHQHIPRPDPMANAASQDRRMSYAIRAVPTIGIDGTTRTGGGPRGYAAEEFQSIDRDIAKELQSPPGAKLSAEGRLADGAVKVRAKAEGIEANGEVKLQVALVEKHLRYSGENGIRFHPMVVRALASQTIQGPAGTFDASFDLGKVSADNRKHLDEYEKSRPQPYRFAVKKSDMDPAMLAAVVFVEDASSHRILQSRWLELAR